jgi:hypothetical protein
MNHLLRPPPPLLHYVVRGGEGVKKISTRTVIDPWQIGKVGDREVASKRDTIAAQVLCK